MAATTFGRITGLPHSPRTCDPAATNGHPSFNGRSDDSGKGGKTMNQVDEKNARALQLLDAAVELEQIAAKCELHAAVLRKRAATVADQ